MRHRSIAGTALLMVSAAVAANPPRHPAASLALPLAFEPAGSGYLSRGDGFSVLVTGNHAEFALRGGARLGMSIVGGVAARGEGKAPYRGASNYLLGADRSRWRTGVPTFARARFDGVLPGIDIEYYGRGRLLEFDFGVEPHADPSRIQLRYDGATRLRLDAGDLVIETTAGELRQQRPHAYQETAGGRRPVAAAWVLRDGAAAFRLGRYDRSLPLVIDPAVNFSSYLGGSLADAATAMAIDAEGWVYLTGTTTSPDFPGYAVTGATGAQHAFLAKMHPALTGVESMGFCTWFGGNGHETPTAIAVDAKGVIYIAGHSSSADFPVTDNGAQLKSAGGTDLFLIKLGVFGDSLVYSTLLGGAGNETGGGLAINSDGIAYLAGGTASRDFPVTSTALQKALRGTSDAVLARVDTTVPSGSLTWSSYFGGSADDSAAALALDSGEIAWVGGTTQSADFPKAGKYLGEYPGVASGFVARIDMSGHNAAPLYSTVLGAAGGRTEVRAVAADAAGNVAAAGITESPLYPTSSFAVRRTPGGAGDAFFTIVSPFSPTDVITYSTLLGGAGRDAANALTLDAQGIYWVAGSTASSAFPASTDAFQQFGGNKAFLTGLNPRKIGSLALVYSTAIGGNKETVAQAVVADKYGNPYVTGRTTATDFPLGTRRFQDVPAGAEEGFLTVFEFQPLPKPQRLIVPNSPLGNNSGGGGAGSTGRPSFTASGISNAASAVAGVIAPGEIVRISGANLGPDTPAGAQLDQDGKVATSIAQIFVTFDGTLAPLLSVSAEEILAIVPYEVAGRVSSSVLVTNYAQISDAVVVPVADAMPGIFASTLANQDGSTNSSDNPAAPGSLISFLATGEGQTDPAGVNGLFTTGTPPVPVLPLRVLIDGVNAVVVSAGEAPGRPAGYLQVVAQIPDGVSAEASVVLVVGTVSSPPTVSIAVAAP
jgi:uncharacterized protein (TIGR03437 family)